MKIDKDLSDGVLKKYITGLLSSEYSRNIMNSTSYALDLIEPDTEDDSNIKTSRLNVMNIENVEYLLLVTKLEAFSTIIDIIKNDNNIVCSDDFISELNNYQDKVPVAIRQSVDETQEKYGK